MKNIFFLFLVRNCCILVRVATELDSILGMLGVKLEYT